MARERAGAVPCLGRDLRVSCRVPMDPSLLGEKVRAHVSQPEQELG